MAATVSAALRRFLPAFLAENPPLSHAQRRAVWAITHCRTATLGGHLHGCEPCGTREFVYHSCNHRSCPQCGKQATAEWVERELGKRVGAPYFMVTFTLPKELRTLFFSSSSKEIYQLFFAAASSALSDALANPRWLGAVTCGFSMVLHTWNQRLLFHPHIHCIVPGAGIDAQGRVVTVKRDKYLVPLKAIQKLFRARFRDQLAHLVKDHDLPAVDPGVWKKAWGVHLQPFGSGENIIRYLGRYVARTAIGDSRLIDITDTHLSFRWKDRANGNKQEIQTITGTEFVRRYLRHVLPRGLHAIRHFGFCHPAAKLKRERIAFHTGRPLRIGALVQLPAKPKFSVTCSCCGAAMKSLHRFGPSWRPERAPPIETHSCA